MDETAKAFITSLLEKNPMKRLGANGVDEIMASPFFEGVDWAAVSERRNLPLLKPNLSEALTDVRNFAAEFTNLLPVFSPAERPNNQVQDVFRGYSFISPSVIFSNDNGRKWNKTRLKKTRSDN
jgi:serine/threonine protein kinase